MARCIYCKQPEFGSSAQPLCRKHLELRAIALALKLSGKEVNARSVKAYLDLITDPVQVQPKEVARLLRQMRRIDGAGVKSNKEQKEQTHV